ncbi:hypothetical protein KBD45_08300 [Candidatus Dojkabacteria bacterium]|nr:hypothetical protein [Candidatus Dojkabacteria bacterium]
MQNEEQEIDLSNDEDTTLQGDENNSDTENVEEGHSDSEIDELKKKIETLTFQKDHWKQKATENKPQKQEVKSLIKSNSDLSTLDIIALSKADIVDEDIVEVLEYAKFKKISVSEALKSNVVKATLAEKKENRKAAEASNIGNGRRGISSTNDTEILNNARRGNLPKETDDDAIMKLAKIRK